MAILVSRRVAPYTEVATRLEQRLGKRATLFFLPTQLSARRKLLTSIEQLEHPQLVTIGLDASVMARQIPGSNQVFCQVFNYTENGLIDRRRKGVSMLPGVAKTLATWKRLAPTLHEIAIISGPGLDQVIRHTRTEAASQGITVTAVTVNNDKQYLYAYKQLADRVQGYWIIPDNRVLSIRTLREVMTFSVRNSKQVVVFNDDLLRLGGLMSVESSYDEIADKVMQRLTQAQNRESVPGDELMPLSEAVISINPVMVKRLGLEQPGSDRKQAGEATAK